MRRLAMLAVVAGLATLPLAVPARAQRCRGPPLDLGWPAKRADVTARFQFHASTGRYTPGADDNLGIDRHQQGSTAMHDGACLIAVDVMPPGGGTAHTTLRHLSGHKTVL